MKILREKNFNNNGETQQAMSAITLTKNNEGRVRLK